MTRRLAGIVVGVAVFGVAASLWSATSYHKSHQRRPGGDADVRAPAVPRASTASHVNPVPEHELAPIRVLVLEPESRELPALREVHLAAGSGGGTEAIAFDGTSLWVASQFQNTVTRVRVSDGKTLETVSVGRQPVAVFADPSGIWVANLGDDTVTH